MCGQCDDAGAWVHAQMSSALDQAPNHTTSHMTLRDMQATETTNTLNTPPIHTGASIVSCMTRWQIGLGHWRRSIEVRSSGEKRGTAQHVSNVCGGYGVHHCVFFFKYLVC